MLGQVMPISCRKNVTMLFTETSLGICTSLRSPSSQLEEALEQVRAEVVEEQAEALGRALAAGCWRSRSGSSAMSLTTFLILATTAQNAAGGMPSSSSSPSMMNLTGSSRKRLIALTIRPMSPPAFLRSSAISARTSSTAALGARDEVLVEVVARRDRPRCAACRAGRRTSPSPGRPSPAATPAARRRSSRCARGRS